MASSPNPRTENSVALAWAMTALGGALFLLGVFRLIAPAPPPTDFGVCDGIAPTLDANPALLCLKLAGWFATAGGLVERFSVWQTPLGHGARAAVRRVLALVPAPSDGVLDILLGGILFIVLLLGAMVSLWHYQTAPS